MVLGLIVILIVLWFLYELLCGPTGLHGTLGGKTEEDEKD